MNISTYRTQLEKKSDQEIAEILATPKNYQDDFIFVAREISASRIIGSSDVREALKHIEAMELGKTVEKLSNPSAIAIFLISPIILASMVGIYVLYMIIGGLKSQGYHKKASQMWFLFACGAIGTPIIIIILMVLFFFVQSRFA